MTISITGSGANSFVTSRVRSPAPATGPDKDFDAILEAFRKAASETPEQRAREAVLEKHELSEEDYKQLPPKARDAIDREIVEAVKQVHERKTGVPIGETIFTPAEKLFG